MSSETNAVECALHLLYATLCSSPCSLWLNDQWMSGSVGEFGFTLCHLVFLFVAIVVKLVLRVAIVKLVSGIK